ncbi:MAG: DUF2924 domain-containing protein [candidate division Zixibacteria bacterium]|nr:DUF2924 domain-containing protein [candidate division Zixibacteria bacterium]
MRISRTDLDPAQGGKQQPQDLEAMDLSELQAKYKEVFGEETIARNRVVLIGQIRRGLHTQEIKDKREARTKAAEAKAEVGTPTIPERLEDMSIENLQRTLNALTTRKVLTRDRATLLRMITKIRQKQQEQLEVKAEAEIEAAAEQPSVTDRLAALTEMNLGALREEYEKVFGKASLSRNRKQLVKKIAEKIQADAAATGASTEPALKPTLTVKFERKRGKKSGGKGKGRSKRKAAAEGKETATTSHTMRQRDPRLPKVGTTIERVYKGKKLLVRVTEDGFEYQGKPYRSLSALAMAITGAKAMNGFLFFALGKYAKKEKAGK